MLSFLPGLKPTWEIFHQSLANLPSQKIPNMKITPQNLLSHRSLMTNLRFFFFFTQACQRFRFTAPLRKQIEHQLQEQSRKIEILLHHWAQWVVQGLFKHESQSTCIHLIWLHPHCCLSSVIALAKGIWKILQRHWSSLDKQLGLDRKTKYFIKIKLTLYCGTDNGKITRNWLGTRDTSCPSWMGGWIDGWTDRYCTKYSHNRI